MHPATSPSPAFTFRLNGQTVSVEGASLQQNLLNYIRGLGLTGAKEGCAEGECGACTVVLVKPNGEGSEYRTVNSCLMLLPMAAGQEIYTVESLDKPCLWGQALSPPNANALHPVQQSLVDRRGLQLRKVPGGRGDSIRRRDSLRSQAYNNRIGNRQSGRELLAFGACSPHSDPLLA